MDKLDIKKGDLFILKPSSYTKAHNIINKICICTSISNQYYPICGYPLDSMDYSHTFSLEEIKIVIKSKLAKVLYG